MSVTLAELLNAQTQEQVFALLLASYQALGFPTQSWQDGGTELTRLLAISTGITSLSSGYIPTIAAGGLVPLAAALPSPNWIRLLSLNNYNLPYNEATYTTGTIRLNSASITYTITAGQLTCVFGASGNRYINTNGGTLTGGSHLNLSWISETPGAKYHDPSSSGDITLVTPLPGVTLTNVAGNFSEVAHVGAGTGTVDPSGSPVGFHQVTVRITSTGASGVAGWSTSLDGAPAVSQGAVTGITDLGGTGIDIDLTDGGSGTSFVSGDEYLFTTPGTWITVQGSDDETGPALGVRCSNRWSSLSLIPTGSYYELLVASTPTVGSQVTQAIVFEDLDINDKVNIIVAGPEGALPPGVIATIQAWVNPRAIGTDFPVVQSPAVHQTVIGFTGTATAAQLAVATAAVTTAIFDYVDSGPINPLIRIARIIEIAMEQTGMVDVGDVTIDGVAANLSLGSASTFVVAQLIALNISWRTA